MDVCGSGILMGSIDGDSLCTQGLTGSATVSGAGFNPIVDADCVSSVGSLTGLVSANSPTTVCCFTP